MLTVPPADESIARVDIFVLQGRGHYPVVVARIPGWVSSDLLDVVDRARELDPSLDPSHAGEAVVRSIWRLGITALKRSLARKIPIPPRDRLG